MIVTKEEAKTKWCPFARSHELRGNGQPVTVNRSDGGHPETDCFCIASTCMAWRWADIDVASLNRTPNDKDVGYCGLAGKP